MIQKDFVKLGTSLKLTITDPKAVNWERVRTTFQALLSGPRAIKSVSNDGYFASGHHVAVKTYKPLV